MTIKWSELSVTELTHALRTLPRMMLYSWIVREEGWTRASVWEYAEEGQRPPLIIKDGGLFRSYWDKDGLRFESLNEAQAHWDAEWIEIGWQLIDSEDGSSTPSPPPSLDWASLSPIELAGAIRTIPRLIAYAWTVDRQGMWVRWDVEEYGCAQAACIVEEDGLFRGPSRDHLTGLEYPKFETLEACKQACDRELVSRGWLLNDLEARPPDAQTDD